jgi:hypothetical protein
MTAIANHSLELDTATRFDRKNRPCAFRTAQPGLASVVNASEICRSGFSVVLAEYGDARVMGLSLSVLHETLAQAGVSNVDVVRRALCFIGQCEESSHARMALDLARQADAMNESNPYHNADHLREVTVSMANLVALNVTRHEGVLLDRNELTIAIALAVGHDLGHDGATNNVPALDHAGNAVTGLDGKPVMVNVPFLLEDKAIAAINVAGRRAGVPEADLRWMRAAILTTDENTGYKILDAVFDPHYDPALKGELLALRPELAALGESKCLRLATMLRDADLLGSAGTSVVENDRETDRLERERGMDAGALRGAGTEYFLGTIARGKFLSPEGRLFQDNIAYLRQLNAARLQTPNPKAVTLAQTELFLQPRVIFIASARRQ